MTPCAPSMEAELKSSRIPRVPHEPSSIEVHSASGASASERCPLRRPGGALTAQSARWSSVSLWGSSKMTAGVWRIGIHPTKIPRIRNFMSTITSQVSTRIEP